MSRLLITLLLLHLLQAKTILGQEEEEEEEEQGLYNDCPPSRCGKSGLVIRFPLGLKSSSHDHCTLRGLNLSCSANHTLLFLSASGSNYNVTAINYFYRVIKISRPSWAVCPWLSLHHYFNISNTVYRTSFTLINCSAELASSGEDDSVAGPITCLSGAGSFVYAVESNKTTMDSLPSYCITIWNGMLPFDPERPTSTFRGEVEEFNRVPVAILEWEDSEVTGICSHCESERKNCGYNRTRNQTFCINPLAFSPRRRRGSHVILITGLSIAALIILISVAAVYYISQKSDSEKEIRLKVERFLATYKDTKPTRYTYAGIKKITKRFNHNLGQGGYGSVYKGELSNGIPVAVKMLEISKSDGEEFINEVATMGKIHHVNVVRLLGFCSEGTRRALVYEFMPNKSLDKFIFLSEAKKPLRPFSMEKLQEIAIGIAQGIEYLHQGCNQRILHFDIKPHNILLDHDFNPKISDFGLAKLCSRDQSIVTMTAARGTMGYIAPEIYSRNFGAVSYKSDVYSFGMLMLDMVSGQKNIDPLIGNQSEVYFPEWIYVQLVQGENLGLAMEMDCNEEIVRKLTIISLWCIQWSPADRPSMTRVVQMLMGNLQSLQIPPKPFVSSSDQNGATSILEV